MAISLNSPRRPLFNGQRGTGGPDPAYPQEYQNGGNLPPMGALGGSPAPRAPLGGPFPPGEVGTGPHAGMPMYGSPVNGNTGIVPPPHPVATGGHGMPGVGGVPATPQVLGRDSPRGMGATDPAANLQQMLHALTGANFNPAMLANGYMDSILSQDNPYIRDARQRGAEMANARGMLNSNMAAGSAERSAIEAAQPLFSAAMGLNSQREQQGWQTGERVGTQNWQTGERVGTQDYQRAMQQASWNWQTGERVGTQNWQAQQAQYDRQLKSQLQSDATFQQNWLSSQDFSRQFNASLALMPINTANQFMQTIQQYAIENPEIYTPEMISGMQNFFTQSMAQLLAQFFPNLGG